MSDSPSTPFQAPDPATLAPLFPGYTIQSLIACGGMGAVYHARQTALDRDAAIKILPRELSLDASFRDGFSAEAKAMARLNHPNLISVYDFGEVDGMLFLIMEFVPGQSLFHAMNGGAVEPQEARRLLIEICAGLAHAHQHGILHRDIKPANILLDQHGHPKIGDFGLARPIGSVCQEGEEIFGTPHYTAPEVISHPAAVDARADIFSLGVLLHELLTGKLPAEDPRPPSALSACGVPFDAIVKRATHPNPALRYPDAAAMANDLGKLAAPVANRRPAPGAPRARKPASPGTAKTSSGLGGLWIVLLLAAAIGAYFFYSSQKPKEAGQPSQAVAEPPPPPANPSNTTRPTHQDLPKLNLPAPSRNASTPQNTAGEATSVFGSPIAPGNSRPDSGASGITPFGSPTRGPAIEEPAIPRVSADIPPPVFDVEGFLNDTARQKMSELVKPAVSAREQALAKNLVTLESDLKRPLRELDRDSRVKSEAVLAEYIGQIREAGRLIPAEFAPTSFRRLRPEMQTIQDQARKRQQAIEETYAEAMKGHAATYIRGIRLQIDRLRDKNDPGAINVLEQEIKLTQEQEGHFAAAIGAPAY